MVWQLITVGKPALPWAKTAAEDYLHRLSRHQRLDWTVLKDGPPAVVTRKMLEASEDSLRVILDERGGHQTSRQLAQWVQRQEMEGTKRVSLLIGGADGHSPELKALVKERWSLSHMTLQHEVALVVLLEQVYRAYTIMRGEPYHRD
jgi:23S rRNA (pseudouridine1915-N3)-methyltransferase